MNAEPTLKYAGSKRRIADWIVGHLPQHSSYVEPFFGSGAVYFSKPIAPIEIINDLDDNVFNFFKVVRDQPLELTQICALTPWSQAEYKNAVLELLKPFDSSTATAEQQLARARNFVTASWQMFGRKNITARNGWRFRYLSSQSPLSAWNKLPSRIFNAAERLMQTQISKDTAKTVIAGANDSTVLIYADPPYLGSVRTHGKMYEHEMKSPDQHAELLEQLDAHQGMVVLSGYHSEQYNQRLAHWTRFETTARSQSNRETTEVIWLNPSAAKNLGKPTQSNFFDKSNLEAAQ